MGKTETFMAGEAEYNLCAMAPPQDTSPTLAGGFFTTEPPGKPKGRLENGY